MRVTPKGSIDFPGRVLSTSDAKKVTIGGDKQARDAFLQSLLTLLDVKYEQTGRDRAAFIANMVLRLSTDNEIIDQESGAQLIKLFCKAILSPARFEIPSRLDSSVSRRRKAISLYSQTQGFTYRSSNFHFVRAQLAEWTSSGKRQPGRLWSKSCIVAIECAGG